MSDDMLNMLTTMQRDPAALREHLEANLAQLAAENPALSMMMQMMQSRREQAEADEAERREHVARKRTRWNELRDALANAHELLDDVASALGACPDCWGEQRDCAECRGKGAPGWRLPDAKLFAELVAPAVRRVARAEARTETRADTTEGSLT